MQKIIISNNLVHTGRQISAVFELEPVDLIILPENEQKVFEMDMKRMLHSLQELSVQILMRTRKAVPNDLGRHFNSFTLQKKDYIRSETANKVTTLISRYAKELARLLEENIIPVKEYFVVFKEGLKNNTAEEMQKAISRLERKVNRIATNFKRAGINLTQLQNKEDASNEKNLQFENGLCLTRFIQSFTRL